MKKIIVIGIKVSPMVTLAKIVLKFITENGTMVSPKVLGMTPLARDNFSNIFAKNP